VSTHESYGIVKLEPPDPDYGTFSFTVHHAEGGPDEMIGDGSRWVFDHTTVQPDITAYELAQILSLHLSLPDGILNRLKSHYRIMRHFRHEPVKAP
jgi:hypothetical protein